MLAGARLIKHAQFGLGASLGAAALMSHNYHATQLREGDSPETRVALLADYGSAGTATFGVARRLSARGGLVLLRSCPRIPACFALGVASFVGGIHSKQPEPYLVLHGAWHVFTAAAVYQLAAL